MFTPPPPALSRLRASGHRAATLAVLALAACGGGSGDPITTDSQIESTHVAQALAASATTAPSMTTKRFGHSATLLANGKVLVAGGFGDTQGAITGCELYDPERNAWSAAAPMLKPHGYGRAVVLNDGRVLVVGGLSSAGWGKLSYAGNEIYDPATNRWTAAAPMAHVRTGHTATRLADGRVLVTGGTASSKYPNKFKSLTSTEIYDPTRNSWSAGPSLPRARSEHTAALQADGRVLIAGFAVDHFADESTDSREGGIDHYDPVANSWQNVAYMVEDVSFGLVAALPDGRVLTNRAVLEVGASKWTALKGLATDRPPNAPHVLFPDGAVMTLGGGWNLSWNYGFNDTARQDFYDPAQQTWAAGRSLSITRDEHSMTLLPNGKVLVAGGRDPGYLPLRSAELVTRGAPLRAKAARSDFDGNGKGDILWQHTRTGALQRWSMNGLAAASSSSVSIEAGSQLVDVGDINGDGKADLLLDAHEPGGALAWLMDGSKHKGTTAIHYSPHATPWSLADLHGDDHSTVVWRDGGSTMVLLVDPKDSTQATWSTDVQESVVAIADFNGDRRDDLVIFDKRTGTTSIWLMHGPRRLGNPIVLWRDAAWTAVAAPDLDGDGKPDLLLRRASTGTVMAWMMNGTKHISSKALLTDKAWAVAATPDLDGDGKEDIVWYRASTGSTVGWLMNGATRTGSATLRTDAQWRPVGP